VNQDGADIMRAMLPVLTFMLGMLLSVYERRRSERLAIRNVQIIVMLELANNLRIFNMGVPPDRNYQRRYAVSFANHFGLAKADVLNVYLGKIGQLPSGAAIPLYVAFHIIDDFNTGMSTYLKNCDANEDFPGMADDACRLLDSAYPVLEKVRAALVALKAPTSVLEHFDSQRGLAYLAYRRAIGETEAKSAQ
jgi:hypothetical protein